MLPGLSERTGFERQKELYKHANRMRHDVPDVGIHDVDERAVLEGTLLGMRQNL
jgi:hypothetical protein